jgi:hypothetical protein
MMVSPERTLLTVPVRGCAMVLLVPLMMLERKAVDMDAHEEKNEPNFCAVLVV